MRQIATKLLWHLKKLPLRDSASFYKDEEGVGTIELVLILVVLIGLVVVFRNSIGSVMTTIMAKINASVATF